MKYINRLTAAVCATVLLSAAACDPHSDRDEETIPDSLSYTEWYSQGIDDDGNTIYYFLTIEPTMSTLTACDAEENGNILSQKPLEVTYDKPNVKLSFFDGGRFAGYIIDKQYSTINGVHVYVMQLFETDDSGNILKDDAGDPLSTMIFWKE